ERSAAAFGSRANPGNRYRAAGTGGADGFGRGGVYPAANLSEVSAQAGPNANLFVYGNDEGAGAGPENFLQQSQRGSAGFRDLILLAIARVDDDSHGQGLTGVEPKVLDNAAALVIEKVKFLASQTGDEFAAGIEDGAGDRHQVDAGTEFGTRLRPRGRSDDE